MTSLLDVLHGSRAPRVSKYPRGVSSAGQDAVELAASAGLFLDPWQQDVLEAALQERSDGKWAAFEVGLIVPRQNGKGSILEARELAGLFLFGEQMIVHTSHEFKTTAEAFRRIRTLIESTPDLDRKVKNYWMTTGREGIELKNGSQLRFLARSKGSGRGFSGDLVILDEAFALEDTMVEALLPTLSARPNPQLWYTSSPPLDGVTGEPLYALRARGESPEPPDGLCWLDWGARLGVDPDDRAVWAASNPALGYRITEEFIARERAAMTAEGFSRERLGVWPKSSAARWQAFPQSAWEDATLAFEPPESLALCVTLSADRQWASICAAGALGNGLYGVAVLDRREGTGWVVDRLFDRARKLKPVAVLINKGGPEGSLFAEVSERNLAESGRPDGTVVELVQVGPQNMAAADSALWDAIAGPPSLDPESGEPVDPRVVRHLGQPELTAAAAGAVWKVSASGSRQIDPAVGEPSAVKGCAVALMGFREREPAVAEPWAFAL